MGSHFWISVAHTGDLQANLVDTNLNNHSIIPPGTLRANQFQHVAVTYEKHTGMAGLYVNGLVVETTLLGTFTPLTSFDAYIGLRPAGSFSKLYFQGRIGEVRLYNRSLTKEEICALFGQTNRIVMTRSVGSKARSLPELPF
jgi:hypothetical protein